MTNQTLTPVDTDAPPETVRRAVPPPVGVRFVIDGRPGWSYPTLDEACEVARDLVRRLKLSQHVKIRQQNGPILAMTGMDGYGGVHVVRFERTA